MKRNLCLILLFICMLTVGAGVRNVEASSSAPDLSDVGGVSEWYIFSGLGEETTYAQEVPLPQCEGRWCRKFKSSLNKVKSS